MIAAIIAVTAVVALGLLVNLLSPAHIGYIPQSIGGVVYRESGSAIITATTTMTTVSKQLLSYQDTASVDRMLIYRGQISLEVVDLSKTMLELSSLVDSLNGYVAGSSTSNYDSQKTGTISIRIPKLSFQNALSTIEGMGVLKDRSTSSEDITEQYIDLKARLTNLQSQEETLRGILSKAVNVPDVLAVQKELERVRGDIDSLTGTLNYLEKNVEMSLITVNLTEPKSTQVKIPGPDWGEVVNTAIFALYYVARGLTILIVALIPIAVITVPILYLINRRSKKTKATQSKEGSV